MKRSIYAAVVILGITGGACAADFGDLAGKTAAGLKAVMVEQETAAPQIPEPRKAAQADVSELRKKAEAILANPDAFTIREMGDVIVNLDEARSCLPRSSTDRQQLDALRDGVDRAQLKKVRDLMGTGMVAAPVELSAVRKEAEAILANPDAFTIREMGDVIVNLDEALSCLPRSCTERKQLAALRDSVDRAQLEKIRQMFHGNTILLAEMLT